MGQHRECCALRGLGWGKPHATVNYVFNYSPYKLFQYHYLIMAEMKARGYQVSIPWLSPNYRGQKAEPYSELVPIVSTQPLYPEHNDAYLTECLDNLKAKGIDL